MVPRETLSSPLTAPLRPIEKGNMMVRHIVLSGVLASASLVWAADPVTSKQAEPQKADRSFGTALQWETTIAEASKKASRQNKLLMVLAVAGHFEDPFFT
jgi:hypothetical protein